MAKKTNYRFLKQQRETKKGKRQEDKLRRKGVRAETKTLPESERPGETAIAPLSELPN